MKNDYKNTEVVKLPKCDFCRLKGKDVDAEYDAKTVHGPWAYMCKWHFSRYGIGLGEGKGQKLIKVEV